MSRTQHCTQNRCRSPDSRFRGLVVALLTFVFLLFGLQNAGGQQQAGSVQKGATDLESQKLKLEVEKLQFEVDKLKLEATEPRKEPRELLPWLTGLSGLLLGLLGFVVSAWVARRTRTGALDQATHEKRLEHYPNLVNATARLALYFPGLGPFGATSISPSECGAMGRKMSEWYFAGGGLLLSQPARDAYFDLTRALTRASLAKTELKVPQFPDDAAEISKEKVDRYQELLVDLNLGDIEKWEFGSLPPKTEAASETQPHFRFKDYIFLQRLSSLLRTRLSEDLRSRLRPS